MKANGLRWRMFFFGLLFFMTVATSFGAQEWGRVELLLPGGESLSRKVLVEFKTNTFERTESYKSVSYDFSPAGDKGRQANSIWLWRFMPDRLIVRKGKDGKCNALDFVINRGRGRLHSASFMTSRKGKQYFDASLLCCLLALGEVESTSSGKRRQVDGELLRSLRECSIRIGFKAEKAGDMIDPVLQYKGINLLQPAEDTDKPQLSLRPVESVDREPKLWFVDMSNVPLDGGVGGRRQRIWFAGGDTSTGVALVMDLEGRSGRFGNELKPFDSNSCIQFVAANTPERALRLLSHVRYVCTNRWSRAVDPLPEDEIKRRLHRPSWLWNVCWKTGNRMFRGTIQDSTGQIRWGKPKFKESRRNFSFEWFEKGMKTNDVGIEEYPRPGAIELVRGEKGNLTGINIHVKGGRLAGDKELGALADICMGLLTAMGCFESGNTSYDYGGAGQSAVNHKLELEECEIQVHAGGADADNGPTEGGGSVSTMWKTSSRVRWVRDYSGEGCFRYCFAGDIIEENADVDISFRRAGTYENAGLVLKVDFPLSPFAKVISRRFEKNDPESDERSISDSTEVEVLRVDPRPGELFNLLDSYFRGRTITRIKEKTARSPISSEMLKRLTVREKEAVYRVIQVIKSAKWGWILEQNISDDIRITWEDLSEYMPVPARDLATPRGGSYTIGTLEKPVAYGYADGNPFPESWNVSKAPKRMGTNVFMALAAQNAVAATRLALQDLDLASGDEGKSARAIAKLQLIGDAAISELLKYLTESKNQEGRTLAAGVLTHVDNKDKDIGKALIKIVELKRNPVSQECERLLYAAIAACEDGAFVKYLRDKLEHEGHEATRITLATILARRGQDEGWEALLDLLSRSSTVNKDAIESILQDTYGVDFGNNIEHWRQWLRKHRRSKAKE